MSMSLLAPLLSMTILALGNGLYTTYTTLALKSMGASLVWIGVISSMFFVGLMVGAYRSPKLAQRIGYIRSYTFFAAFITLAVLIQGMSSNMWVWLVARFASGYAFAGLFVVLESWILHSTSRDMKGRMLAVYLLSYYIAQSSGQLLLNIPFEHSIFIFCLIAAFSAASILPVSATRFSEPKLIEQALTSPKVIWKKAPLGLIGGFASGILLGSIYSIYPLYLQQANMDTSRIAWIMFATIFGGALLQYPIGKFSDMIDRRKILLLVLLLSGLLLSGLYFTFQLPLIILCTFIMGGFIFAIYPLSISHTCDYLEPHESISAISILTIFYGLGSSIGPFMATQSIHIIGHSGFLIFMVAICGILSLYTYWRIMKREPAEDTAIFVSTIPETVISTEEIAQQLDMTNAEVLKQIKSDNEN
jgi:MFS family permease